MKKVAHRQRTAHTDTVTVESLPLPTAVDKRSRERIELTRVVLAKGSLRGVGIKALGSDVE